MEALSNKAYSLRSRRSSTDSCSSLRSFVNQSSKKQRKTDRMIRTIDKSDYQWSQTKSTKSKQESEVTNNSSPHKNFQNYLTDQLSENKESFQVMLGKSSKRIKQWSQSQRKISSEPFKSVRFKYWRDNFYTNLLEWNYDNIIFAASEHQINQYSFSTFESKDPKVHNYFWVKGAKINAIKCSPSDKNICIAYDNGSLRIYDYYKERSVYMSVLHSARITALDWREGTILTGSKDRTMKLIDGRTFCEQVQFKQVHQQEVLGIKRCGDLIATGGNDNLVAIYDIRKSQKLMASYEHEAAVKSLAWIENEKILLSGGGTSDKVIKFWNSKDDSIIKEIETGSQVCNIVVSKTASEFVSCQGFSQNQIVLWDFQGNRVKILHGKHSARVLYSVLSPSGEYLATGAGDQNLLIWKMFPPIQRKNRLLEVSDLR